MSQSPTPEPALQHWPAAAAERLRTLIRRHAHQGAYAVFDADNTTYHHGLVCSLLPFMEARGVLTRDTMHPALKIIPFRDGNGQRETLHSYYFRLGDIDDQIGYPWASQIFAGFTLRELKGHLDDMLAAGRSIPAQYYDGDRLVQVDVEPPRLQRGQQELYQALMAHVIEVFVVSAAAEELVRMVLSDYTDLQSGLGFDYFSQYPKWIDRVTKEDVQRVAKQYLNPQLYALVWWGILPKRKSVTSQAVWTSSRSMRDVRNEAPMQATVLQDKLLRLRTVLTELGSVVVAYSGGIDSTFVLKVAHEQLGEKAIGITAVSPTFPVLELEAAKRVAHEIGARHELVQTDQMAIDDFIKNDASRCFHCKTDLY